MVEYSLKHFRENTLLIELENTLLIEELSQSFQPGRYQLTRSTFEVRPKTCPMEEEEKEEEEHALVLDLRF